MLEPVAQREGRLVLYNFAGNFDPVWKDGLIPRFEARYGVKVEYHNVRRDQANQQLVAVHRSGRPSPVDVYFAGGPDNLASLPGVVAPYRLADLLPNLAAVPAGYKNVVFGIDAQGRWPIVHRSQLVLGYDSALLSEAEVPRSFEALVAWAEKHPKKFAFTSPAKGGSGAGFVYSAALHFVEDAECRKTLADVTLTQPQAQAWAMQAACLEPLWAYLTRLLKAAELTNGNADTLNLMNNRQALIGTAWEDQALTFVRAKLLPASFRATSLQPGLVSGGDGLIIAANAKSPAAALLFVDMAFGREFQAWKLEHHASRSPRNDVDVSAVTPQTARHLVPAEQARAWSVPVNWIAVRGLTRAFEEKVLSRL
ncbi:MAG TPA: extracellular solute-binding protein [Albitalea sp.]